MPGRLVIFCGIPGSGKTTVAKLVARVEPGSVHLQTDAMRGMITGPNFSPGESDFVYEACIAVAREALDRGRLVILDATFNNNRRREGTIAALAGHYSRVDFVHVVCDLETAVRRNSSRKAVVPEENLRGIHSVFEAPADAIRVDTSRTTPEEAAEVVLRALYPLVPPE